jgi:transglutaminase-like putative cysteine protease
MTNLTREMMLLLTDGCEYRVAYAMTNGAWDVVDRFMAMNDTAANAYAETYFAGQEWYVLDREGRNINGGDQS